MMSAVSVLLDLRLINSEPGWTWIIFDVSIESGNSLWLARTGRKLREERAVGLIRQLASLLNQVNAERQAQGEQ